MFQDKTNTLVHECPNCGKKLEYTHDLFRCVEHGSFFIYGPQLLVHIPRQNTKLPDKLLPWENQSVRFLQ